MSAQIRVAPLILGWLMIGVSVVAVVGAVRQLSVAYGLFIFLAIGIPIILVGAVGFTFGLYLLRVARRRPNDGAR